MLNLVARTADRETVRADLLESKSRIVINQRQNVSLLEEATA